MSDQSGEHAAVLAEAGSESGERKSPLWVNIAKKVGALAAATALISSPFWAWRWTHGNDLRHSAYADAVGTLKAAPGDLPLAKEDPISIEVTGFLPHVKRTLVRLQKANSDCFVTTQLVTTSDGPRLEVPLQSALPTHEAFGQVTAEVTPADATKLLDHCIPAAATN